MIGLEPTTVGLTGHCSQPIIATSPFVAQVGLEPTRLSASAFETDVYTNSTTEPYITQNLDMNRLTLGLHLSRKG